MTISVIIPTLNEAARIPALLGSLQKQTFAAHEIIVVDGNSDDDTRERVRLNKGVLLVECERGTARQRNVGAYAATGELLVWIDADCLPHSHFLENTAGSYKRFPFAVACPWFVARDSGLLVRAIYFGFNVLFWLGQGWLRTGSGVCLVAPRDVWKKCGGFDESLHLGEDVNFLRRAAKFGLHRHLLIPLETSGRRFDEKGALKLTLFYARITPLILFGRWQSLQKQKYEAAPYKKSTPE